MTKTAAWMQIHGYSQTKWISNLHNFFVVLDAMKDLGLNATDSNMWMGNIATNDWDVKGTFFGEKI